MWKLGSDVVTLIGALSTEYPSAVDSRILYFPESNRRQSRFRIGTSEPQIQDSQIGRILQGHLDQASTGAEPRPCPSAPRGPCLHTMGFLTCLTVPALKIIRAEADVRLEIVLTGASILAWI